MRKIEKPRLIAVAALTFLVLSPLQLHAQRFNSAVQTIALLADTKESLSLMLSTSSVNFSLMPARASNPGSASVTATTTWNVKAGRRITTYVYFANAATALSSLAGYNIPSSKIEVSTNGGAFVPLTNTTPFGGVGAGLTISTKVTGQNKQGTDSDTMQFNINLSTLPQLPAGTYTGTVSIRAQAI